MPKLNLENSFVALSAPHAGQPAADCPDRINFSNILPQLPHLNS
jgi:hypothetical protein